jgi:hypothetical protein
MNKIKPNRNLQRKWIHALESGDFQQGHGYLKLEDRYCCLGVACALTEPEAFKPARTQDPSFGEIWHESAYGLPDKFRRKLGLLFFSTEDSVVSDQAVLQKANDSGDYSFQDIAQVLRCWLEIWD